MLDRLALLHKWQKHQFRDEDILFGPAAEAAAAGDTSRVFPQKLPTGAWLMMDSTTGEPAVFTFAVRFLFSSDLYTGTLVPDGETRPPSVPEHVQTSTKMMGSNRCAITFDVDVGEDTGLFDNLKKFERLISSTSGFNPGGARRTTYQKDIPDNGRFRIRHRLFRRATPGDGPNDIPQDARDDAHPWLMRAITENPGYTLNRPYPSYLHYDDDNSVLLNLSDVETPYLQSGDILVMTFRVGLHVSGREWGPDIMPEEIIRVVSGIDIGQPRGRETAPFPVGNMGRRLVAGMVPTATDAVIEAEIPSRPASPDDHSVRVHSALPFEDDVASIKSADSARRAMVDDMDVEANGFVDVEAMGAVLVGGSVASEVDDDESMEGVVVQRREKSKRKVGRSK